MTLATEATIEEEVEKGISSSSASTFLESALNGPHRKRIGASRIVRLAGNSKIL